jgi:hypothetical protein
MFFANKEKIPLEIYFFWIRLQSVWNQSVKNLNIKKRSIAGHDEPFPISEAGNF